jgi:imidazolonepropionase-like amidohydrolase
MAGCTSIEHGTFPDDATQELMAQRGVYFDSELPGAPQLARKQGEVSGHRQRE